MPRPCCVAREDREASFGPWPVPRVLASLARTEQVPMLLQLLRAALAKGEQIRRAIRHTVRQAQLALHVERGPEDEDPAWTDHGHVEAQVEGCTAVLPSAAARGARRVIERAALEDNLARAHGREGLAPVVRPKALATPQCDETSSLVARVPFDGRLPTGRQLVDARGQSLAVALDEAELLPHRLACFARRAGDRLLDLRSCARCVTRPLHQLDVLQRPVMDHEPIVHLHHTSAESCGGPLGRIDRHNQLRALTFSRAHLELAFVARHADRKGLAQPPIGDALCVVDHTGDHIRVRSHPDAARAAGAAARRCQRRIEHPPFLQREWDPLEGHRGRLDDGRRVRTERRVVQAQRQRRAVQDGMERVHGELDAARA